MELIKKEESRISVLVRKCLAEALGAFALIFFGTGAVILNDIYNGQLTHIGIAFTFGVVIMIFIYIFGDVSGAHFNPAVTIGLWVAKRIPGKQVFPYIAAQVIGGVLGSFVLWIFFKNNHVQMGATIPAAGISQSVILEILLTFVLMLVILGVTHNANNKNIAGIAIGLTVLMSALVAGPLCGASMNPMRSLAPALFSPGALKYVWIYILSPVIGAVLAVSMYRIIFIPKAVPAPESGNI